MGLETPVPPKRSVVALLVLTALVVVLTASRELPLSDDTIGVQRLVLRTRWAAAGLLLRHVGLLQTTSARQLVGLDRGLRSEPATNAAVWLASNGTPNERLRWSSALTLKRPGFVRLLGAAIDDALASDGVDCGAAQLAHRAVTRLPHGTKQRAALQRKLRSLARSVSRQPVQTRDRANQPRRLRSVPCRLS
jgi:hypothetical protein